MTISQCRSSLFNELRRVYDLLPLEGEKKNGHPLRRDARRKISTTRRWSPGLLVAEAESPYFTNTILFANLALPDVST